MKRMIFVLLSAVAVFASGCAAPTKSNSTAANPAAMNSVATNSTAATAASPPVSQPHATALEGSWTGIEITDGKNSPATLNISGLKMSYRGAEDGDWARGTFTLYEDTQPKHCVTVVTECASADYVGTKGYSIYKLENGVLTLTGNQLGNSDFPSAFDAPDTRRFVFKRDP